MTTIPTVAQAVDFAKLAEREKDEAVRIRRHLHRIPELCYEEKETAAFVADYLKKLGLEVRTGVAGTGVVAVLRGTRNEPVVGLRADMDALPIQEKTGLAFASTHPGKMHACGHDAHMTHLLLSAKLLASVRAQIPGTVVFLFQPCEEGPPLGQLSGAERMIQEGALSNPKVEAMIGHHVLPDLPLGVVGVRKGAIMANVTSLEVEITGQSSHGAFPHKGVDAVVAAANAVVQLQTLVSRNRDPLDPAVLSFGTIHGGVRRNVLAGKVLMEGTLRTFSFELQESILKGIERILEGIDLSFGTRHTLKSRAEAPYVKNDPALTDALAPALTAVVGPQNLRWIEPLTIAEDFAHYSHQIPALLFFLGVGGKPGLHTPEFSVDERVLTIGPALFASAALSCLQSPGRSAGKP